MGKGLGAMLRLTVGAVGVMVLAACTGLAGAPRPTALSPLYNVTPDMLRPDGTFANNGLFPINPNDQR